MSWVDKLLNEYKKERKTLNKKYKEMDPKNPDRKIIGSMVRDMTFVIEWLSTGSEPVEKRDYKLSINVYWDDDLGGYVSKSCLKNPYLEVERRIDRELERKKT